MSGELKKFLIEAYTSDKYDKGQKPVKSFEAMINPTSYTIKHEIQFQDAQGKGNSGSPQVYDKMKPREFTFDFIIDGTGVTGVTKDVEAEVKSFLDVAYNLDGDIHRPRYLRLSWGTFVSNCVLKTADITYNLHLVKKNLGFATQENSFYSKLSIQENYQMVPFLIRQRVIKP